MSFWSLLCCWWISLGLCGNTSTARSDSGSVSSAQCPHLTGPLQWKWLQWKCPFGLFKGLLLDFSKLAGRMQVRIEAPRYKLEAIVAVVNSTQNLGGLMRAEFEWRGIRRAYCRKGDLRLKKIKPQLCFFCAFQCNTYVFMVKDSPSHSDRFWQTWGCPRAPVITQFEDSPPTIDQMRQFSSIKF